MKKYFLFLIVALMSTVAFTSCSDDDDDIKIDPNDLYGKWELREVKVDGKWYDVTEYPYTRFAAEITFYSSGRFYGDGYFGHGSGKYEVKGNTVNTYIDGELYMIYRLSSLSDKYMEGTMSDGDETISIKAEKIYSLSD